MSFKLFSDVRETSSTGGTGNQILAGAIDASYNAFGSAGRYVDGDTFFYGMKLGTQRELGRGTYNAGANSIARTQVYKSTNGNALVNFGAGTVDIFVTNIAHDDLDAAGIALLRTSMAAAKSGANSDITALSSLTGGATFPNYATGVTFAGGSRMYDTGSGTTGPCILVAAGSRFDVYDAAGATLLYSFAASSAFLKNMPVIGATNVLLQMSRAANGYIKFWDGTGYAIIQWGSATLAADGAVTFPTAFPNNCRQVVVSMTGAPATTTLVACSPGTISTTAFNGYPRFTTGSTPAFNANPFSYIAIGD